MSSFLLKSLARKPLTFTARHSQLLRAAPTVQLRNVSNQPSQQKDESSLFPVYVHHVSKIVLQHLQDSRAGWLAEQGLNTGLNIKSNGTFVLKFPSHYGADSGKIWTSYDASTRQHWISVYRQKFNAKFVLKQRGCRVPGKAKMEDDAHIIMSEVNAVSEDQIRAGVDEMIRRVPPNIRLQKH